MTDSPNPPSALTTRFGRAFESCLSALRQLPVDELQDIDFEIPWGACLALEAMPRILATREQLATLDGAGPFRLEFLGTVEGYALAAAHAHARHMALADSEALLDGAVRRGHALRELLTANTVVLAVHGVIEHSVAHGFKGNHGYQDIAAELLALVELWRDVLGQLDGKTMVTPLHLIQAECYADQLLVGVTALGEDASVADVEAANDERRRAFTAFSESYDPIRAALTYLFHKEDSGVRIAPAIAPRDQRLVRLSQLERAMTYTPREEWDPQWQDEFDRLYYDSK
jgi:hypothetical protein